MRSECHTDRGPDAAPRAAPSVTSNWIFCAASVAQAIAYSRDAERADAARFWLEGYESLHVICGRFMFYAGPVRRYTGLLEATLGNLSQALADLHAALESAAAIGAHPWVARTHLDLAAVYRQIDPRNWRRCASRQIEQAIAVWSQLRTRALELQARAALDDSSQAL